MLHTAVCGKWVSGAIFLSLRAGQRIISVSQCSLSSLVKFNNPEDSDKYWLGRLDHKDWLAPNEVLKIFQNLRDPELILGAFEKASGRMDYKPREALYSLLVDRLAYARNFHAIDDLLERAKAEKCILTDEFFYKVIKIYGNVASHPEKAIATLLRMPDFRCWPMVRTFNCVLNMLVCTRKYEAIHEVYLSAPKLGITLDTCCFNILIKGQCQWGNLDAAFSLLNEIPKQGCRPNATTYSTIMHFLCKNGRVSDAFELCEKMEAEGCYPDTVTFNILISGLCKQKKLGKAMELLSAMQLKGCYPNSDTYQAIVYGFLDSKKYVEAKDFMGLMISKGWNPSFLSYKMTIEGLCSEKLLDDVDLVLKQMVHQGFVPRMGTWVKILKCMFL